MAPFQRTDRLKQAHYRKTVSDSCPGSGSHNIIQERDPGQSCNWYRQHAFVSLFYLLCGPVRHLSLKVWKGSPCSYKHHSSFYTSYLSTDDRSDMMCTDSNGQSDNQAIIVATGIFPHHCPRLPASGTL